MSQVWWQVWFVQKIILNVTEPGEEEDVWKLGLIWAENKCLLE